MSWTISAVNAVLYSSHLEMINCYHFVICNKHSTLIENSLWIKVLAINIYLVFLFFYYYINLRKYLTRISAFTEFLTRRSKCLYIKGYHHSLSVPVATWGSKLVYIVQNTILCGFSFLIELFYFAIMFIVSKGIVLFKDFSHELNWLPDLHFGLIYNTLWYDWQWN